MATAAVFGGADELVSVAESTCPFSAAACHPCRDHRAALTIEVFPVAAHLELAAERTLQVGACVRRGPGRPARAP